VSSKKDVIVDDMRSCIRNNWSWTYEWRLSMFEGRFIGVGVGDFATKILTMYGGC